MRAPYGSPDGFTEEREKEEEEGSSQPCWNARFYRRLVRPVMGLVQGGYPVYILVVTNNKYQTLNTLQLHTGNTERRTVE